MRSVLAALCVGILCLTAGCSHKQVRAAKPPPGPASDENSFLDLTAGSRLRILVPLLKAGKHQLALDSAQSQGTTVTVSAHNLIGYEVSYYSAEGQRDGKVHLTFLSADSTKNGQTVPDPTPPNLPFPLPPKTQFVRLIFLVRVSDSDHNMAIVAANTRDALQIFTTLLKQNPRACQITEDIFCVWVPENVAVRPEPPPTRSANP